MVSESGAPDTHGPADRDPVGRVTLEHADGSTSPLLLVPAERTGESAGPVTASADSSASTPADPPAAAPLAVLVLPGIAVGARYYLPLARELAAGGLDVAVTEIRGQGESTHVPRRAGPPAGYHESAAEDVPAALDALEREFGPRRVVLLGHSMGAQIGAYHLARRDPRVVGLVGVATQSPWHRGFDAPVGRRLRIGARVLPLYGLLRGTVPESFFGATGVQPATRIRDWARLAARGRMQPARADIDYPAALREVTVPVLLVAIAGDDQAPPSAGRELLRLLPAAPAELEVEPTELGHNRWARTPGPIVRRVLDWADRTLDGGSTDA